MILAGLPSLRKGVAFATRYIRELHNVLVPTKQDPPNPPERMRGRVGRRSRAAAPPPRDTGARARRKSVRTIREGFNYQDLLGAIKLLDTLRDARTALVTLESSDGTHVDDVVVETSVHADHYQVKWAAARGAFYSFENLMQRKTPRSASLLTKFAKSWRRLRQETKPVLLHLFTKSPRGNNIDI